MLLPNRHGSTDTYRYGFQGQEKDDEIKGEGNSINYKFRMHDPRVGRFFAADPLEFKYPYLTPYQFSSNQPIHTFELEGLESNNELGSQGMDQSGGNSGFAIPAETNQGEPLFAVEHLSEVVITADKNSKISSKNWGAHMNQPTSDSERYGHSADFAIWHKQNPQFSSDPQLAFQQWDVAYGDQHLDYGVAMDKAQQAERLRSKLWVFTSFFYMAEDLANVYFPSNVLANATAKVMTKSYSFKGILAKNADDSQSLFHYTSEDGYNAIMESLTLKPSIGVKNARFGNGQYFTDIAPGTVTPGQLSARLYRVPWNKTKITHYFEINTKGLDVMKNKNFNYLNPSSSPLDISKRIKSHGLSF